MTERVGTGLVIAYVLLIPVRWSPFPANVQWSEIVFLVLFIWFVARGRVAIRAPHPMDFLVIGYLLGGLASLLGTADVGQSLLQYAKHLYLGLVYYVFSTLGGDQKWRTRVVRWFSGAAGVLAGGAVVAVAIHGLLGVRMPMLAMPVELPYLGKVSRVYGPLWSPAYFANYLTFSFPLVLASLQMTTSRWRRRAWILAGAMIVVADVLTLTYSFVGLVPAGLYYLWGSLRVGLPRALRAGLLLTTMIGLVVLNIMLIVSVREVHVQGGENPAVGAPPFHHGLPGHDGTPTLNVTISYNLMSYFLLKQIAWEAFRERPWTGIGIGEFHRATEYAYQTDQIHQRYRAADPHSTWLGRLAETGLVGGVLLLTLWGGVGFLALRARGSSTDDASLTRALLAGTIGLLVNSINIDIMNSRFLWLGLALLGGSLAGSDPRNPEGKSPERLVSRLGIEPRTP